MFLCLHPAVAKCALGFAVMVMIKLGSSGEFDIQKTSAALKILRSCAQEQSPFFLTDVHGFEKEICQPLWPGLEVGTETSGYTVPG